MRTKMKMLMPMAGSGIRFKEMGYEVSKPAIPTYDLHTGEELPMVVCATKDVPGVEPDGRNVCFVERDFHRTDGTEDTIRRFFPNAEFIMVDHLTDGGACTCLLAEEWISNEDELIIAGCDNGMEVNWRKFNNEKEKCDLLVFTFRNNSCVNRNPSAYGWMVTDEMDNITGVSIKKAISNSPMDDHAVVATFWFRKGSIFIESAKKMIAENDRINNEFYVDQVVKHALELGYHARVLEIDRYIAWGTPADFENYRRTFTYWSGFYRKERTRFLRNERGEVFTIGIAGDSGSGKSQMIEKIRCLFGSAGSDVLFMEGDGEHKWARHDKHWEQYTALNPDANDLYRQADNVHQLRKGNPVERREYHHDSGLFGNLYRIIPHRYVVLCGLHALYLPELRKELDLKIYIDTEEKLRLFWKLQRDSVERGYSREKINEEIVKREEDAKKYIYPQREYADVVVSYFDSTLGSFEDTKHEEQISVKFFIKQKGLRGKVLNGLTLGEMNFTVDTDNYICFDSDVFKEHISYDHLMESIFPDYKDAFPYKIDWNENIEGMVQCFVLLMIVSKLKELSV